jgi:hypothetical protein
MDAPATTRGLLAIALTASPRRRLVVAGPSSWITTGPAAARSDGLVLEVQVVLPLALLDSDGEIQRLRIWLARTADLELDAGVEPFEGLAGKELPA